MEKIKVSSSSSVVCTGVLFEQLEKVVKPSCFLASTTCTSYHILDVGTYEYTSIIGVHSFITPLLIFRYTIPRKYAYLKLCGNLRFVNTSMYILVHIHIHIRVHIYVLPIIINIRVRVRSRDSASFIW